MSAAEHQRSGTIEAIEELQFPAATQCGDNRQDEKQAGENGESDCSRAAAHRDRHMRATNVPAVAAEPEAEQRTDGDRCDLGNRSACESNDRHRQKRDRGALPIRRKRSRHAPDRLGDHRHGDELQPVNETFRPGTRDGRSAERHRDEQDCRGQRESAPRRHAAREAPGPDQSDGEPGLARRRSRQELAQRHQIAVTFVRQPAPADDELLAKVAEVCDRPPE